MGGDTTAQIWYGSLGFYDTTAEFWKTGQKPSSRQLDRCLGANRGSSEGVCGGRSLWTHDEVLVAHMLVMRNRLLNILPMHRLICCTDYAPTLGLLSFGGKTPELGFEPPTFEKQVGHSKTLAQSARSHFKFSIS